jgi:hypothetical protein
MVVRTRAGHFLEVEEEAELRKRDFQQAVVVVEFRLAETVVKVTLLTLQEQMRSTVQGAAVEADFTLVELVEQMQEVGVIQAVQVFQTEEVAAVEVHRWCRAVLLQVVKVVVES